MAPSRPRDLLVALGLAITGVATLAARIRTVGIDVPVGPDLVLWAGPLVGFAHFEDAVPPAFGALTALAAHVTGNVGDGGRLVSLLAAGALPAVAWLCGRAWGLAPLPAALLALLTGAAADVAVAGALFQPDALGMAVLLALVGAVGAVRARGTPWVVGVVCLGGLVALQVRELLGPVAAMAAAALVCGGPRSLRALVLLAVACVGPALVVAAPHLSADLLRERALLPVYDLLAFANQRPPLFLGVKDVWWPLGDAQASYALQQRYGYLASAGPGPDVWDAVVLNARQALAIAGDVDLLLALGALGWTVAVVGRKERAATVGLALLLPAAWSVLFWTQRRHHALFLAPALLGLAIGLDTLLRALPERRRQVAGALAVLLAVGIAAPQVAAGHAAQKVLAQRLGSYPESPASARDLGAAGRAIAALAAPGDAFFARPDSPQERLIPALVAGLPVTREDCPAVGVTLWQPAATLRAPSSDWVVVEGAHPPVVRCAGLPPGTPAPRRPRATAPPPPDPATTAASPPPAERPGRPLAREASR